ncbi:MAG: hypothetical protein ACHQX3_03765, partial [Nitrospirales bacterium]
SLNMPLTPVQAFLLLPQPSITGGVIIPPEPPPILVGGGGGGFPGRGPSGRDSWQDLLRRLRRIREKRDEEREEAMAEARRREEAMAEYVAQIVEMTRRRLELEELWLLGLMDDEEFQREMRLVAV